MGYQQAVEELLKRVLQNKITSSSTLEKEKRKVARQFRIKMIRNSDVLARYRREIETGDIQPQKWVENLLQLKSTRTLSGVVPVAIFTKPYSCPGECIYCPLENGVPKSYLSNEPAVMRAKINQYDPKKQILSRLQQYHNIGHPTDKIELIIKGGTWSAYPKSYQRWFIKQCFDACNLTESANLSTAQDLNEQAPHRLVGINIETRPDFINLEEISRLRGYGVTKVEIGVQSIYNDVLKKVSRGHTVEQTIKATKLLKDAGLEVSYHLMPNLPGSDISRDIRMFKEIFEDSRFCPDMLKIYPCVLLRNAPLYKWYLEGKYQPYTDTQLINLLVEIKKDLPVWIRIDRLTRDIPATSIVAGCKISNIREVVQREMQERDLECHCIRCREIRGEEYQGEKLRLERLEYEASEGKEYFLSLVDKKERIHALLRLRIPSSTLLGEPHFIKELDGAVLVRQLKTFGPSLPIKEEAPDAIQHKGLGKRLMDEAEKLVKSLGIEKLAVTAGVGVRDYYRKLEYSLGETYMVK